MLEPKKTKLVPFARPDRALLVDHARATNCVTINGVLVPFNEQMEHVGVLRDVDGNMTHVLHRISQHKKALASVMFNGTELIQQHLYEYTRFTAHQYFYLDLVPLYSQPQR